MFELPYGAAVVVRVLEYLRGSDLPAAWVGTGSPGLGSHAAAGGGGFVVGRSVIRPNQFKHDGRLTPNGAVARMSQSRARLIRTR
jgi:hypothetical protein